MRQARLPRSLAARVGVRPSVIKGFTGVPPSLCMTVVRSSSQSDWSPPRPNLASRTASAPIGVVHRTTMRITCRMWHNISLSMKVFRVLSRPSSNLCLNVKATTARRAGTGWTSPQPSATVYVMIFLAVRGGQGLPVCGSKRSGVVGGRLARFFLSYPTYRLLTACLNRVWGPNLGVRSSWGRGQPIGGWPTPSRPITPALRRAPLPARCLCLAHHHRTPAGNGHGARSLCGFYSPLLLRSRLPAAAVAAAVVPSPAHSRWAMPLCLPSK